MVAREENQVNGLLGRLRCSPSVTKKKVEDTHPNDEEVSAIFEEVDEAEVEDF